MTEEERCKPGEAEKWIKLQDPVGTVTMRCARECEIVAAGQAVVRDEGFVAYGD